MHKNSGLSSQVLMAYLTNVRGNETYIRKRKATNNTEKFLIKTTKFIIKKFIIKVYNKKKLPGWGAVLHSMNSGVLLISPPPENKENLSYKWI